MRIGCWKPKATNTHSEYVILIAFPLQQWSHERVAVFCYTCIACLVRFPQLYDFSFWCITARHWEVFLPAVSEEQKCRHFQQFADPRNGTVCWKEVVLAEEPLCVDGYCSDMRLGSHRTLPGRKHQYLLVYRIYYIRLPW